MKPREIQGRYWISSIGEGLGITQVSAELVALSESDRVADFKPLWFGIHPTYWSFAARRYEAPGTLAEHTLLTEHAIGWPFRAVGVRAINEPIGSMPVPPNAPPGTMPARRYPTGEAKVFVIWPGLIVNLFAGPAVVWGSLRAWDWFLRWIAIGRVSRGLCGICGHSREGLAETTTCPECGASPAITARTRTEMRTQHKH
ncbi:MAG: hypothetical protein K2X32_12760 [Phycisphaerales bacterium]|nr:hypothetical protein [Phycisphaerales bacterium]